MDPNRLNREAYDAVAHDWDAARSGFFRREEALLALLTRDLAPGSLVLDAGCGTGRPFAEALARLGHRVLGVDQSEGLLALARQRLPEQRWVLSALEDYPFGEPVDAMLCWDALFHIPRQRHEALWGRMATALRPGGRLLLTVGGSAHAPFTDSMYGREFFYDSHPPEESEALLRGAGLEIELGEYLNRPDGGRDKGRYAILARRPLAGTDA